MCFRRRENLMDDGHYFDPNKPPSPLKSRTLWDWIVERENKDFVGYDGKKKPKCTDINHRAQTSYKVLGKVCRMEREDLWPLYDEMEAALEELDFTWFDPFPD